MKIKTLIPNSAVVDIRQTVKFYCENLGFELGMAVPETQDGFDQQLADDKEYVHVLLKKDEVLLMFQRMDSFQKDIQENIVIPGKIGMGASMSFYMQGKDIEAFHEELKNKNIQVSDLKQTWYGNKEFYLQDNNGYILCFAEEVAKSECSGLQDC
jgi:uncharacterized glyoxalase superfamily protein PhnB